VHPFAYTEPHTLEEALAELSRSRGDCAVLAGGTDLLVMMQQDKIRPGNVVNIGKVPGLGEVTVLPGRGARIGALATIRAVEKSIDLNRKYPIVGQAVRSFGGITIRNMATIGGNLARGNPSADLPPVLMVLGALAHLWGPEGERVVPMESFFVRPGVTVLRPDELLTEVELPEPPPTAGGAYIKQCQRGVDLATVGVAAFLAVDRGTGLCLEAGVALAGAASVPLRCTDAEQILRGQGLDDEVIGSAAAAAACQARPREDSLRASPDYRRRLIRSLTERMIRHALGQALGQPNSDRR
jgi:aerobic carbon-monoxide dehydrogenase medium subunit